MWQPSRVRFLLCVTSHVWRPYDHHTVRLPLHYEWFKCVVFSVRCNFFIATVVSQSREFSNNFCVTSYAPTPQRILLLLVLRSLKILIIASQNHDFRGIERCSFVKYVAAMYLAAILQTALWCVKIFLIFTIIKVSLFCCMDWLSWWNLTWVFLSTQSSLLEEVSTVSCYTFFAEKFWVTFHFFTLVCSCWMYLLFFLLLVVGISPR